METGMLVYVSICYALFVVITLLTQITNAIKFDIRKEFNRHLKCTWNELLLQWNYESAIKSLFKWKKHSCNFLF